MTKKGTAKKRKMNSPGHHAIGASQSSQSLAPTASSQSAPVLQCKLCTLTFDSGFLPLQCGICDDAFHDECLEFDSDSADLLRSIVDLVGWACNSCIRSTREARISTTSSKANLSSMAAVKKLQGEVSQLKSTCASIHNEVTFIKTTLQDAIAVIDQPPLLSRPQQHPSSHPEHHPTLVQPPSRPTFSSMFPSASTGQAASGLRGPANSVVTPTPTSSQDLLILLERDKQDKENRSRNVIITGLRPAGGISDAALVNELFEEDLNLQSSPKFQMTKLRRIGKVIVGKVRPLLLVCDSANDALMIVSHARNLRYSRDSYTASSVFINPDRTAAECTLAFEKRERHRAYIALHPPRRTSESASTSAPDPSFSGNRFAALADLNAGQLPGSNIDQDMRDVGASTSTSAANDGGETSSQSRL